MTLNTGENSGAIFQAADVKACTESDQDRVIATIELAFSTDPVVRWAYSEPHQFLSHFPRFAQAFAGRAFQNGTAHYVGEFAGAALWLPPGVNPDEDSLTSVLFQSISGEKQEDVMAILEQMGSYHPSEPHWYLPMIGVDPAYQGKGYGSALLRHALANCDRSHGLAYLESSNPRNIPLYERHGFRIVGEIQAGSSPTIYPMVRDLR
jgi:ribosomal protein S18 acetylase RimI-like enzyme